MNTQNNTASLPPLWSEGGEFNFRDETRSWFLNPYYFGYCPECHGGPQLYQTGSDYRLACRASVKGECSGPWNTPWLRSSKEACNHWRMTRLLSEGK